MMEKLLLFNYQEGENLHIITSEMKNGSNLDDAVSSCTKMIDRVFSISDNESMAFLNAAENVITEIRSIKLDETKERNWTLE